MSKIRTFVAIKIPDLLVREFRRFISDLQQADAAVKWVKPEAIHLTLKFLGSVEESDLDQLYGAVEQVCEHVPPFSLRTSIKGGFPSLKRPRVFWVGLGDSGLGTLEKLQTGVEAALEKFGFPREERRFRPHLTIGRVKHPGALNALIDRFRKYPFPEIEFTVEAVVFMKSQLTPQGAIYSLLKTIPLQGME